MPSRPRSVSVSKLRSSLGTRSVKSFDRNSGEPVANLGFADDSVASAVALRKGLVRVNAIGPPPLAAEFRTVRLSPCGVSTPSVLA